MSGSLSRRITIAVIAIASGSAGKADAQDRMKSFLTTMLSSAPNGSVRFGGDAKYQWAEYCPDNTCTVLRAPKNADARLFGVLAAAYFVHVETYVYLREWQEVTENRAATDAALQQVRSGHCRPYVARLDFGETICLRFR